MAILIWVPLVLPLLLAAVSIVLRSRAWTLWLPVSAAARLAASASARICRASASTDAIFFAASSATEVMSAFAASAACTCAAISARNPSSSCLTASSAAEAFGSAVTGRTSSVLIRDSSVARRSVSAAPDWPSASNLPERSSIRWVRSAGIAGSAGVDWICASVDSSVCSFAPWSCTSPASAGSCDVGISEGR